WHSPQASGSSPSKRRIDESEEIHSMPCRFCSFIVRQLDARTKCSKLRWDLARHVKAGRSAKRTAHGPEDRTGRRQTEGHLLQYRSTGAADPRYHPDSRWGGHQNEHVDVERHIRRYTELGW